MLSDVRGGGSAALVRSSECVRVDADAEEGVRGGRDRVEWEDRRDVGGGGESMVCEKEGNGLM